MDEQQIYDTLEHLVKDAESMRKELMDSDIGVEMKSFRFVELNTLIAEVCEKVLRYQSETNLAYKLRAEIDEKDAALTDVQQQVEALQKTVDATKAALAKETEAVKERDIWIAERDNEIAKHRAWQDKVRKGEN